MRNSPPIADASPTRLQTPSAGDPQAAVPSLLRRMACWTYEAMLVFAVAFFAVWLFSTLGQMRHALDERRALLQAFLVVVLGIYFVWFWARGQTLAMKTWRIRVVAADGGRLRQPRALLRYLLAWLWVLPPLALARALGLGSAALAGLTLAWIVVWALLARLDRERQFLHDRWAGTRLVNEPPPGADPAA